MERTIGSVKGTPSGRPSTASGMPGAAEIAAAIGQGGCRTFVIELTELVHRGYPEEEGEETEIRVLELLVLGVLNQPVKKGVNIRKL